MRILRAADYKIMPWKNGMGSTTEIAVSPEAEGFEGFDWRISMARVETDGPFSPFPGIDRTLLVLEGDGIILKVADHGLVRLDRESIHSFPGDQPTYATLIGGPIVDLNVMSRRDRFQHNVSRLDLTTPQVFPSPSALTVLLVERGAVTVQYGSILEVLANYDGLVLGPGVGPIRMESAASARLVLIAFR
ncbi:environmental stress-induced protein Ves [Nitrobacteraceae bacterium AZCC 2161]